MSHPTVHQYRLDEMVGGWFVGAFEPAVLSCAEAEVAVKSYSRGDSEAMHLHRVATEVTLLVSGRAEMCDRIVEAGDILVLEPGVATEFRALEDCVTVVVKTPSVLGDKYTVDGEV